MSNVISHASVVNLSYNAIATIPAGLPGSMTALDLSKNQLSGLYGLENVSNLRELYLGGNSIERYLRLMIDIIVNAPCLSFACSTWGLTVATSLEILDLSSNNIKLIEG